MCRRITYIFLILQVLFCACGKEVHTTEEKPGGGGLVNPLHPGEDAVLTVATCNVLKPEGRRDEMSMELSIVRQALAGSIKDTKADIIGFNELDETLITNGRYSLKSSCTMADMTWKLEWPNAPHELTPPTYTYANGFAFNSAKLQLEESGYVWLSKEKENTWYVKPASAYKNAGSPARTCIWARFTHKDTGKVFWLFVTHLPTESQGGSYNMAGVLNSFALKKAGSAPAILTGDMNCSPAMSSVASTATYRRLISYWTDGNIESTDGTQSGSSTKYYYSVDDFTKDRPDRRIDHIMTRGCSAGDYHTIVHTYTYDGNPWCPSDHLPVVATITLK